jgi:ABC-type sugar transport system ATPase subunit
VAGVTFDGITKRFGDHCALDDLSLEIADGELMVLLGPSGCGKTTALRLVAGLETATAGRLLIGDRAVDGLAPRARDVAMVFQSYALYPHLTVAANIESPLRARPVRLEGTGAAEPERRRLTKAERTSRVRDVAARLELTELLDRKPAALSGGQRQRVALARAIVARPSVFLLDEPLSNLDATLRAQTRVELVELHRRLGTTMVHVTHDQVEAMTMATRIALLDHGRLQQVGAPHDVYERPANLFVARFVGSPPMNTIPATLDVVDGRPVATVAGGGSIALLPGPQAGAAAGREVVAGIRAEHLCRAPAGAAVDGPGHPTPSPAGGSLAGVVAAVEWLGHERHVVVQVGGEFPGRSRIVVREAADALPTPVAGDRVELTATPDHVHLFDPATGQRIGPTP